MKRIIALIIGLCLLCPLALAESGEDLSGLTNTLETFLKPAEPDAADDSAQADVPAGAIPLIGRIFFSSTANAFGYSVGEGEPYQLLDGSGNALTEAVYARMKTDGRTSLFIVQLDNGDPAHSWGVIDDAGQTVVPAQYGDVRIYSDRWQAGFAVVESDGSGQHGFIAYDNDSGEKRYYTLDHVDFYLRGALAGTMSAEDFGVGEIETYGDYFSLKTGPEKYNYYGPGLTLSPVVTSYSEEYDYEADYSGDRTHYNYIHNGTGMPAFQADCTLSTDEVSLTLQRQDTGIVDLYGNVVMPMSGDEWYYLWSKGTDYIRLSMEDKEGLLDRQGQLVVPVEYESVGDYEDNILAYGVTSAIKDGMVGFVDNGGSVLTDFIYPKDRFTIRGNFGTIDNMDGTITIVSGAVGEFDDCYDYAYTYWDSGRLIEVKKGDQYALLDMYGNAVADFMPVKDFLFNRDGSVVLAKTGDDSFLLFPASSDAPAEAPADAPADDGTCPSCGFDLGGTVYNFCPNCGAPLS